ncbi:LapA family protein [Tolypothrix sp. FACHB-123]|uniref:LapA family protein n=1 Tax=Tolypothrix sp. FACHB-123 TaxID=2692868 RepID=UPI0016868DAF|nr:LapA family protein [Tolypothrix sp. FACHB-123]MBD2353421.1 LapA family protein [Tolypothrix sp. FACHB-123]
MSVIRLILLVVILGGLTLLLTQNWSPVISLVFLGMRTQPLPLAMWMLLATTAGALTSLLIMSLIKVSTYFVPEQRQTRYKSTTRPRNKTTYQQQPTPEPPPDNQTENRSNDTFDDWDTNNQDDDWNFDENPQATSAPKQPTSEFSEPKTYERQQEPKSSSQSGSVYSYNYREPKNTAVGKTESVYDADYRVIIPPYQPPATNEANDDEDDWSFFDDNEDFDDEKPRR